jgi:hypothetical protein
MRTSDVLLTLCVHGLLLLFAGAKEVTVVDDDVKISVPVPQGFAVVPESSDHFKGVAASSSRRGNDLLALFAPEPFTGDEESFPRLLMVTMIHSDRGAIATQDYFDRQRRKLKQQGERKASETPGAAELALNSPYESSDRHVSMLVRATAPDGREVTTALAFLLIRQRGWMLGASSVGDDGDAAWCKDLLKSWIESVFAANPSRVKAPPPPHPQEDTTGVPIKDYLIMGAVPAAFVLTSIVLFHAFEEELIPR